ncbi:MAG TPA: hypothetical protein VMN36_05975 [Verrucomicrobiales bacterium]|nr:hypothetical protein [Verrucomicrobiales bacterium]
MAAAMLTAGGIGCEQVTRQQSAELSGPELRRLLAPQPFPPHPEYAVATQPMMFFVRGPSGALVAARTVGRGEAVILRGGSGSWTDVQTLDGSIGRVMSGSLRYPTPEEASTLQWRAPPGTSAGP